MTSEWMPTVAIWAVIAAMTGHTGGATATFTFPTGYTTNAAQRAHNDTIDALAGMGYNTAPSDPENPGAFTAANIGTAADNAWCAVTMALKVAPPPPAGQPFLSRFGAVPFVPPRARSINA